MSTELDAVPDGEGQFPHHLYQHQEQQQLIAPLNPVDEQNDLRGQSPDPTVPRRLRLKLTSHIPPPQEPAHPTANTAPHEDNMVVATRRGARGANGGNPSGSEYSMNEGSEGSRLSASPSQSYPESQSRTRATRSAKPKYKDAYDSDDGDFDDILEKQTPVMTLATSSRGRVLKLKNSNMIISDDEEDDMPVRPAGRSQRVTRGASKRRDSFIDDDAEGEEEEDEDDAGYNTRNRSRRPGRGHTNSIKAEPLADDGTVTPRRPQRRLKRRNARARDEEGDYVDDGPSHSSIDMDADGSVDHDDPVPSTPEEPQTHTPEAEETAGYGLRKRAKVNYALPPPLVGDEIGPNINGDATGGIDNALLNGVSKSKPSSQRDVRKVVPWGIGARFMPAVGAYGRRKPQAGDSDSDVPTQTPRRPLGASAGGSSGLYPGGALGPNELAAAAAGTPSNLGKVGTDSALADADPLGVNQNVTFDEVGGLDDHINSLKEMVTLPLLYPEVFQRFNLTPPRGVLFHGPPGTGKTLVARALAASSRSNGRNITFYMRKGADCLSKWVGEAERQLRLLFDEAKATQPSIIFFDEIDGLAPVRSSKQDQIHASIVSTLLALMDGMDGRGQVIVIGATNRPDAIDPALRRPGRFDREFYFPLPALPARQKILSILTKNWAGWEGEKGEETRSMLAKATKGYGGADLRALCTEAALNAVQRRYPQIYKSNERLLLKPESIVVKARDFMISIKKMVPSSARSAASEAKPLPSQLVPLLGDALESVKHALEKAFPQTQKRTILEEAEYEEDEDAGELERELMLQSMETMQIHRPRILLHGPVGMGQVYIGAAVLHHMEGYNVQSLDLGTLMSDSTRTMEAAIVQLFVEAKRQKPSIVFIPSLLSWCAAVTEAARTTVRTMLDSLAPTDPLLLLAIVDGEFKDLPSDVRAWFGHNRENRIALNRPLRPMREAFFRDLMEHIHRPPSQFPDGMPRKKRILEVLPVAPPLPPRQATAAEIAAQAENDDRVKAILTNRLGEVLQELKKRFRRFTKSVRMEYNLDAEPDDEPVYPEQVQLPPPPPPPAPEVPATMPSDADGDASMANGVTVAPAPAPVEEPAVPHIPRHKQYFNMDLERMHAKLYYEGYLTHKEFLDDVSKIVANAEVDPIENDRLFKAHQMYNLTNATFLTWEPQFAIDCERMAQREMERRKEREARRKEKEKANPPSQPESAPSPTEGYAPGTRRSARANGQGPEIPFTPDPERKLKRARPQFGQTDALSADSPQGRSPKRARTESDEGGNGLHTDTQLAEATAGIRLDGLDGAPDEQHVHFASDVDASGPATPVPHYLHLPTGIDATPASSSDPLALASEADYPVETSSVIAPSSPIPEPPTISVQAPEENGDIETPVPIILNEPSENPESEVPPPSGASVDGDTSMMDVSVVARTPTPPPTPPEFHIDEVLVKQLTEKLVDSTETWNVEQLEQLRATCLTILWKHRSQWDRDEMVREMMATVEEFTGEINAMDGADSP